MAKLAQGSYYIRTRAGNNLYLTLTDDGNAVKDGENVYLSQDLGNNDGQEWFVDFIETSGSQHIYEIRSRWCAKNIDVAGGSAKAGTNVQIYTDDNSRAQRWVITDTGETETIGKTSYPVYTIYSMVDKKGKTFMLDAKGKTSGKNVVIGEGDLDNTRKWCFIPLPKFKNKGVYEIRTLLAPNKLTLDAAGSKTCNGVNLQIAGIEHSNRQKFYATSTENGYSLRNIASAKYVDVASDTFTDGANVQLYAADTSRSQDWFIQLDDATKTIDGEECAIASFVAGGNAQGKYVMDVSGAAKANTNVQIATSDSTNAQKWVLVPTNATDPNMPVPHTIGMCAELGGDVATQRNQSAAKYVGWTCANSWLTDGSNGYQIRWRTRDMAPKKSSWKDWGDWTRWNPASVRTKSKQNWYTKPLDLSYEWSEAKNRQIEIQVRSQAISGESRVRSEVADQIVNIPRCPSMSITGATWTYEGLHVQYESDYSAYGRPRFNIKGLSFLLASKFQSAISKNFAISGTSGTFLIPQKQLTKKPKNNSTMQLKFSRGTDQYDTVSGVGTYEAAVSYEGGTVKDMTVKLTEGVGLTRQITVNKANTVRCWILCDGKTEELTGTVSGGKTTFLYPYRFGTHYDVFVSYIDDGDASKWAADVTEVYGDNDVRAHVWNWDNGYLVLWLQKDEPLSESRSYSTQSETHVLAGREHPVVSFLASSKGRNFTGVTSTVEGALLADDKYNCTDENIEELLAVGHVTYRSPSGRKCSVAVTGADITQHKDYATVSIEQTEEQL